MIQVNEFIARNEEERQLFEAIDKGTAPVLEEFPCPVVPALFGMGEVPDWYAHVEMAEENEKDSDEEDDVMEMGRGARRKSEVRYTEMSDRQFEKLCRDGADDEPGREQTKKSGGLRDEIVVI